MREAGTPARDVVVVRLEDSVVAGGVLELRTAMSTVVAHGGRSLVVDVAGVTHVSSTVIGALLWVRRLCARRHVDVVVRHASPSVVDQLERTGLLWLLDVEPAPGQDGS